MLVRWAVPPTIAEGFADAEGLAVGVGRGEDERLCVGEGEGEALPEADGKGSRAMGVALGDRFMSCRARSRPPATRNRTATISAMNRGRMSASCGPIARLSTGRIPAAVSG